MVKENSAEETKNDIPKQALKVPPHDIAAERAVLGAVLIDPITITSVVEIVREQHFYPHEHRLIFSAMLSLFEKQQPVDVVTLTAQLKKNGSLKEAGGTQYLSELIDSVPTSAYATHYAEIVKSHYIRRRLISVSSRLVEQSFEATGDVKRLLDNAESEFFSLSQAYLHRDFMELKSILAESFERLEELTKKGSGLRGVPTGFKTLDNKLSGMQDSNLLILAARPGIGKTTLSLNIALHVAHHEKMPVGIFSLEMSKEELVDRLLVGQGDIDAWRLKTGRLSDDDYTKLTEAMGELSEAPIFIDDTPGASVLEIRTKARKLKVEKGVRFLIVDYLQLVDSGRHLDSRVQEVSYISQNLKNIARELKIPVMALSQLSRAVEQRGEKKPQLADLRESGCLTGDTLIPLALTGRQVPIVDLVGKSEWVWTVGHDYRIIPKKTARIFYSGKKPVYRLKFRSGRTVKASAKHKFMQAHRWVPLDEMKLGEKFALPRYYPENVIKNEDYSDNLLVFLAHMIGDGCFVFKQPIHYTSADTENIEIVHKVASELFGIKGRVVKQENWFHLYLPSPYRLTHRVYHPWRRWLKEHGLDLANSYEKKLPESFFSCSSSQIKLFLKHLWATDGCIAFGKRAVAVYYATTSLHLAMQIQHLLLRLGIQSTRREVKQTKGARVYRSSFHISIQGKTNQMLFFNKIGCFGKRGGLIPKCINFLKTIKENPNIGTFDKSIWKNVVTPAKIEAGLSWRAFATGLHMSYAGSSLFDSGVSNTRLEKIAAITQNQNVRNLANGDIYWDELVAIEKLGIEKVYDITVPDTHNFVAEDIVVHNSIEQDADVVMFLYHDKDDEDLLEEHKRIVKLLIAKHRNGPTAQIDLMFRGDRVKFYTMERAGSG